MSTHRALSALAFALTLLTAMLPVKPAVAEHLMARIDRLVQQATYHGTEPKSGVDCAVEMLAENIDWLEHHIDTYGSVVAKSPDIWGEARLTKFRDEYEKMMFRELAGFEVRINASIAQSDSAFLAQALALSAAAAGTPGTLPSTDTTITSGAVVANLADAGSALIPAPENKTFERFGIEGDSKISLEPVIELDQLSRYLNHLHELRRINEGDDTSDSPGYSLNLVRMPISILPGKLTRTGFGAEVTVTCTPVITDDLMPTTFHNLAINDMVDLLGLPLVRVTEASIYGRLKNTQALTLFQRQVEIIRRAIYDNNENQINVIANAVDELQRSEYLSNKIVEVLKRAASESSGLGAASPDMLAFEQSHPNAFSNLRTSVEASLSSRLNDYQPFADAAKNRSLQSLAQDHTTTHAIDDLKTILGTEKQVQEFVQSGATPQLMATAADNFFSSLLSAYTSNPPDSVGVARRLAIAPPELDSVVTAFIADLRTQQREELTTIVPTGRARRALNPLSPTSVNPVIGFDNLVAISKEFEPAYNGRYIRWKGGVECATVDGKITCPNNTTDVRVDLLDAQRFLQAELEAAYQLLSQPEHVRLFAEFAAPCSGLAKQIRAGHLDHACQGLPSVEGYRERFFLRLHEHCIPCATAGPAVPAATASFGYDELPTPPGQPQPCEPFLAGEPPTLSPEARNTVEALAWALVVESALLNERLNLDVRKVAKSKQVPDLETTRDYLFFLPETVAGPCAGLEDLRGEFQQATEIFKRYVEVRWPIHVFAVDPREQDQNVADVSARKRELQFALALGFVTGQIGVNSLTQYSRELQTQIETIALNRTVVGFGHGDDTFGWRFQPRVQGLFVPNNCGAVRELLCGVSRDYDLRHRQLEPGQRDCTAIVLMPSFVPYADFDVRTNWYKLTNPKNAALTMRETVRLSRAITAMRNSQAQCSECATFYRENEIGRLLKRVDQLDRELPLQTQRVLVPYENTLGGFEMFNTGVTDLSPELIGWYGAPGIVISDAGCNKFRCGCTAKCANGGLTPLVMECQNKVENQPPEFVEVPQTLPICEGEGTTVFLVGDNFSVHDTKVIAGGVCIPHVQLVSRQIMRVTIPSCVRTVTLCENGCNNEYVAVYVATPYGVANHLHIPIDGGLSADTVDQIAAEVTTQLGNAIKQYDLRAPEISISPADDGAVLSVTARCDDSCQNLQFEVTPGSTVNVKYRFDGDPRFIGKDVTFYVVPIFNDRFLGELVEVERFQKISTGAFFPATGDPNHYPRAQSELLLRMNSGLSPSDFEANGELEMSLVYYAAVDGQGVPERLREQIKVKATLRRPDGSPFISASRTAPATLDFDELPSRLVRQPADHAQPMPISSESAGPTEGPQFNYPATPARRLPATNDFGDTNDFEAGRRGPTRFSSSIERAIATLPADPDRSPAESHRSPVELAQFEEFPAPTLADTAFPTPLSQESVAELVAEVESLKQEIANQQAAIQAALERDGDSFPGSAAALAGQSIVNVNVQQPAGHCAWLCDQLECPVAHRFYVRGRECWRNVRDQIPCN